MTNTMNIDGSVRVLNTIAAAYGFYIHGTPEWDERKQMRILFHCDDCSSVLIDATGIVKAREAHVELAASIPVLSAYCRPQMHRLAEMVQRLDGLYSALEQFDFSTLPGFPQ